MADAHPEILKAELKKARRQAAMLVGFTLFAAILVSRSFDLVMMFETILQYFIGSEATKVTFVVSIAFAVLTIALPFLGALTVFVLFRASDKAFRLRQAPLSKSDEDVPNQHSPEPL